MSMLLSWALAAHVTQLVFAATSFNFQPITGLLTPDDVITATVDGHPPPFNVVFSGDGVLITAGPIATDYMPIPQDPKHSIFTLTVPSLPPTTESIVVFIEYISGDTDPFPVGTASIGTILESGSATPPIVSDSSTLTSSVNNSATSTSSSDSTSATSMDVFNSSATIPASSTPDGISSPPPSSFMTSSPIVASSTPTPPLSAAENPKKSKLPAILGGTMGATVSILIAILIWVLYRRCRRLHHRYAQRQESSASSPPPTTFQADMMMMKPQSQKAMMFPVFEPLGIVGEQRQPKGTSRRSMSSRSSRSIDSTHERSPVLGAFSRSAVRSGRSLEEYHDEEDVHDGSSLVTMKNNRGPSRLSPPRTDRQMELEQKIYDLRAQMITMSHQEEGGVDVESHGSESAMHWHHIRGKIKRLEALEFSDWALGMTNQVPEDYFLS
ncbi:hypothetical protein F5050DRAFT_1808068 [Lentinula boryana]|uniref:Uncharacterized protein n=1 Tax=Lentinula boryana TaxID=40481 RepID=A0ABQ8QC98_9AGAR|nr:hypothetical protein F5050DRAFT_1808068 [Lentinula boryana]